MLRLLVFTDEPVAAAGMQCVLTKQTGFKVVAASGDPATLIETAEAAKPDLILLDMTPDMTFGILVELQKRMPGCRIVVWVRTMSKELAYQAIEHGIRGILRKTLPAATLIKCLHMVAEGGLWFEESLRDSFRASQAIRLSRRESQLVTLLAQGLKNKEIASMLLISDGTVKVYLSRLFRKLGVKDRFELALFGLRNMPEADATLRARPGPVNTQRQKKEAMGSEWLRSLLLDRGAEKIRAVVS